MLLRIQPYDCTIEYKPEQEVTLADFLSRANPEAGQTIDFETTVHVVNATHGKMEQIKMEIKTDLELGPLLEQIVHG